MPDTLSPEALGAIVEQGGPIADLRTHFATKEQTLLFYSQYYAEKFSSADRTFCCACSSKPDAVAVYTWQAVYSAKAKASSSTAMVGDVLLLLCGVVHIRTAAITIDFSTRHDICAACWRQLLLKRVVANFLQFIGLLGGIIALLIAPMGIAGYFYFRNDPNSRNDLNGWLLAGFGGAIVLITCAFAVSFAHRLRVPFSLRSIPRFPFRFHSVKKVAEGS